MTDEQNNQEQASALWAVHHPPARSTEAAGGGAGDDEVKAVAVTSVAAGPEAQALARALSDAPPKMIRLLEHEF